MNVFIVHLNSTSIDTSIARIGKNDNLELFFSRSSASKEGFRKIVQETHQELARLKEKVQKILCVVGGSFASGETRIISYDNKVPFMVSKEIVSKLLTENSAKKVNEIEKEIIHTKLNGYDTPSPFGKEATTVELTLFRSTMTMEIMNDIIEDLRPISRNIFFHTFPYIAFKTLSSVRNSSAPYILIEIENSLTTFSLIKENSFLEVVTFPTGVQFILDSLKEDMNVDEKVATSFLKMKAENILEAETNLKLETSLAKAKKHWQHGSNEALSHLSQGIAIPSDIFMIAPKNWEEIFYEAVMKNDYTAFSYDNGAFVPSVAKITHSECNLLFIKNYLL